MPVTIIAEAGVNHNGDLAMAKRMALAAKECGADIVKYQTAVPELVVSRFAEKAEYQKQTTDAAESQLEMIRKLHFSFDAHRELKEYCDSIGIQYLSAPFDIPSVRFLGTLGLPLIKIPLRRDHQPALSRGGGSAAHAGAALHRHEHPRRDHRRPGRAGRPGLPRGDHPALQHPVPHPPMRTPTSPP